jgi:hypothetical protein
MSSSPDPTPAEGDAARAERPLERALIAGACAVLSTAASPASLLQRLQRVPPPAADAVQSLGHRPRSLCRTIDDSVDDKACERPCLADIEERIDTDGSHQHRDLLLGRCDGLHCTSTHLVQKRQALSRGIMYAMYGADRDHVQRRTVLPRTGQMFASIGPDSCFGPLRVQSAGASALRTGRKDHIPGCSGFAHTAQDLLLDASDGRPASRSTHRY